MKKIIKFYRDVLKGLHIIGILIFSTISLGMGYIMYDGYGIIAGILTTIGIFTVFVWKIHIDDADVKRRKKFLEDKYGDDPDWAKYKELSKKFPNL